MLPEAQAHSPPAPLQPAPPAPSARLRPGCPSGFAEVATRAPLPPRLRPQPEPLQVPPVGYKRTEWDDILCESNRFIAAGPQWLDLNPIKKNKKKTNLKYCLLNCQKRTQITFKFAILLFLAAKKWGKVHPHFHKVCVALERKLLWCHEGNGHIPQVA